MPANKVRAEYQALAQIAQSFGKAADQSRQTLQKLTSQVNTLQGGKWKGRGSEKFYNEMNTSLLPAMKRLVSALDQAKTITQKISRIMKDAEDAASAVFKAGASGAAGGADAGGATGG